METMGLAPAGWYVDPSGRFEARWWTGRRWDDFVSKYGIDYRLETLEPDHANWPAQIDR